MLCPISIHALLAESDQANAVDQILPGHISIHALLAESDLTSVVSSAGTTGFLSTLSLRRATRLGLLGWLRVLISIHALLAESDVEEVSGDTWTRDFYPRSPCGERRHVKQTFRAKLVFLSTLSLRRATISPPVDTSSVNISIHALLAESDAASITPAASGRNFYPRSPCGERLWPGLLARPFFIISIHALLAESDAQGASNHQEQQISIHALLAESDAACAAIASRSDNFYPRSPCGERRRYSSASLNLFGFLSTLSLRRATVCSSLVNTSSAVFLSTLSLRRATNINSSVNTADKISIHALLAESDSRRASRQQPAGISIHALLAESDARIMTTTICTASFLSTLSLRRATAPQGCCTLWEVLFLSTLSLRRATISDAPSSAPYAISIHALLAESDCSGSQQPAGTTNFYPRSPCGERPIDK